MTTLISFLGKSQLDSKTGYRTARYRMPDGTIHETAYLGLALAEHLAAERVILLGTESSMWDLLVENVAGDHAADELRLELFDAVKESRVTQSLLDDVAPSMAAQLGRPVASLLIPSCATFAEQQEVLTRLADHLHQSECVVLDLTHGFRHLAMLGFAAARYLVHARGVTVQGLYYGAFDMTHNGVTPVVTLDGLAHLQEWAEAFEAYEASGDFSRFAPLLVQDGFPRAAADALVRAWRLLMVSNVHDAAKSLQPVLQALGTPLSGASELFRVRLQKALRWSLESALSEKFRLLALQSLKRGDALRASIFGLEAFLAREVEAAAGNPLDYAQRKAADEHFQAQVRDGSVPDWKREAFWLLKNVRNSCAHGTPPSHARHAQLLRNPQQLARELEATLNRLTNTP
ncbi:TIGR02221 family CRISPR-associated protein [Hydrogenophilus thermoluteolus]|nr:TIGR02221 family CRISPR-associated protein [Hydrogenophilus thermoluteolus]MBW7657720.1 TIGR02221 family CRISPR-associated protein [Hydrogenophilus thermoluteolus]